jgi:diguanylate cyclase (GGDEF)-like protein
MANAYTPIIRGILMPGCFYYIYVTFGHWRDEKGLYFAIFGGLSAMTSLSYFIIRQHVLSSGKPSLQVLEISGLVTNMLMYSNVLLYMILRFEQPKLVYFSLMAVLFSTTGVTFRATLLSIGISLTTLYWFARDAPADIFSQYVSIGVASAFAAFSMATLLRKAILKQIDARLLADELADTDPLTGVPNRRAVFHHLDHLVATRQSFWMGVFDLDGFKAINDVYGHVAGDKLLCAIAERAYELEFRGSTFGRLGGDEFVVIVLGSETGGELEKLGNAAIKAISAPYEMDLMQLNIGASAGFAHFPSMSSSSQDLYEKADFALYKAKAHLRGRCVLFDAAEERDMREGLAIERALRDADLEQELYLLFQPQFSLQEGQIVSFEALARWESASLGPIPPDKFIRAAERSGYISRVTGVLFRKALVALRQWPERLHLSFNLSANDIADHDFVLSLVEQIYFAGIATSRIEFEITETAVMADLEASRKLLVMLRTAGCKIALDDFGSGYSSFQYLDVLPIDKVKVDKSFVRKAAQSRTSREIVTALIIL